MESLRREVVIYFLFKAFDYIEHFKEMKMVPGERRKNRNTKSHQFRSGFLYAVPPQNVDAEQSILCSILLDNRSLPGVVEIIKPEDFYRSSHQQIYAVVTELFAKNEPVDLITLAGALKDRKVLEQIGGAAYLASLVDTVPVAANAYNYAKIIHDKARLRRLIHKANDIVKHCFENEGEVDEVVEFAERSIFEVAEDSIQKAFFPIRERLNASIEQIEKRYDQKTLYTGVPTGFKLFDGITSGLQPSDLVIIAARPGMGKTALALNIARNAAVEQNVPTGIFSLEMSLDQLTFRMLCAEARINSYKARSGFVSKEDFDRLHTAAATLNDAPIFIDDSSEVSPLEIRAKSRRLRMEHGLGLVIVDYLQLIRPRDLERKGAERRDLEIAEISRSLKALAKELNIPVIALSQLNRKIEERKNKRPQLSDLRESGAIEQDADIVAFIHREDALKDNVKNDGIAEIIVAKHRNGPTGKAKLEFLKEYTRFENLAEGY